jgi:AAA domain
MGEVGGAPKGSLELAVRLKETIARLKIDVVVLDPFVKAHAVEENDNGQIDFVASILAQIATTLDCAIDAPHHVAKGAAEPGNADRGRGASAFKDAGRLVYTLSPMTPEEAETFGVSEEERRRLIRMDSGKVNLVPAAASATWFRLVGVKLDNGNADYPAGDEVQTVEPWSPPDVWDGLSHHVLNEILTTIDKGLPDGGRYSDHGAAKERAAWRAVVQHAPDKTEPQARQVIKAWVKSGLLTVEDYTDAARREPAKGLKVNHAKRPT